MPSEYILSVACVMEKLEKTRVFQLVKLLLPSYLRSFHPSVYIVDGLTLYIYIFIYAYIYIGG